MKAVKIVIIILIVLVIIAALLVAANVIARKYLRQDGFDAENVTKRVILGSWISNDGRCAANITSSKIDLWYYNEWYNDVKYSFDERGGSWYIINSENYDLMCEYCIEQDDSGSDIAVLYILGFATDDGGGYYRDARLLRAKN